MPFSKREHKWSLRLISVVAIIGVVAFLRNTSKGRSLTQTAEARLQSAADSARQRRQDAHSHRDAESHTPAGVTR